MINIKTNAPTWYFDIITTTKSFGIFTRSYPHSEWERFYYKVSITYPLQPKQYLVFLFELYEMKFSDTVLRGGGVLLVYLSQLEYESGGLIDS